MLKVGDRIKIKHDVLRKNDRTYSDNILYKYGHDFIFTIKSIYIPGGNTRPEYFTNEGYYEGSVILGSIFLYENEITKSVPKQLELFDEI